jgi:Na+/H+-translocating membrane pyrophosphatase
VLGWMVLGRVVLGRVVAGVWEGVCRRVMGGAWCARSKDPKLLRGPHAIPPS